MNHRIRALFAAGLSAWESAAEATGVVEHLYIIAGYPIRLRFAGSALLGAITRALAHLEAGFEMEPMLTVHLADSSSTGVDLPSRLRLTAEDRSGAGWIHRGERFRARYQPVSNRLNILDCSRGLALFWIDDAARVPFWERSAPLLYIFHWWMALHGRHLVHAAALGTPAGGALLVGRSGSGKSTAALSCLDSDLAYAGDDYHLITLEPVPFVFSLYNAVKVDSARLESFDSLRRATANPYETPKEKAVLFIHECAPEKISPGFPIRAVLLPRIAHRQDIAVTPAAPATALAALAPSTMFQMRDRSEDSFRVMAELLKQTPSFVLELGADLSQIAPIVSELLARVAAEGRPRRLVSVVIPVYNGERFLGEALKSVFAQDYRPIEVIVIDDGSNDRTADVARSFEGVRYFMQKNQGPSAARNAGIAVSRGEFIAFLDADDLMLPNKIGVQMNYLSQHPDVGCVLSGREIFREAGVKTPKWLRGDAGRSEESVVNGARLEDLRAGEMSSVLVRRQALECAGGFDSALRHVEDVDWLLRLREAGVNVAALPQTLWRRRIHGANLSCERDLIDQAWVALARKRIHRRRSADESSRRRS